MHALLCELLAMPMPIRKTFYEGCRTNAAEKASYDRARSLALKFLSFVCILLLPIIRSIGQVYRLTLSYPPHAPNWTLLENSSHAHHMPTYTAVIYQRLSFIFSFCWYRSCACTKYSNISQYFELRPIFRFQAWQLV